ncbi:neutral/alkaline non-lysosomal ceramidase N-terminal domain-containing protein [Gemmata sp. G18]|uniref:Neutral/alkaline non-lysosomal ceramidase N-terminal domain-containing protein n=1 Tax=Gemmata palustris TaxID=2822762 RepID=A0ABS5C6R8_9BACT|nr:neutral/alkaline non-lysosomal ceramidase N-terminal domain-containing protein [Gemmata palustris]MBP3960808.1 neutral/alkaline non-lysosomal ceramidase N-terminal domain-containing protein [Gemmata palustris]
MRRIAALLLALLSPSIAPAAPPEFRAGAYAMDVTPEKFPVSVNGGFSDRKANSAHDPLHARCLVLDDGSTKLAIVVVDSCVIPRELMDEAKQLAEKKTGIPATNVLVSATHTHTAPTVASVFGSEAERDYSKFLARKIAEGIEHAHKNLVPAKVAWGVGEEPNQVFNRRWKMKPGVKNLDPFGSETGRVKMNPPRASMDLLEPAGPTDPRVTVMSLRTADDKPLALFANYSLHYVGDMPALSADYFGVFADLVGQKLKAGKGFVGVLSNGTSGDVNNINFREPAPKLQPGEQSRVVADAVATAAVKALGKAEYSSRTHLQIATKEIELGVRKPTPDEIKRAVAILDKAKGRELKTAEETYAHETVQMARYPDKLKVPLQVMVIGSSAIVAIPCEVFTEIGLAIKKNSALKTTCVVSLANGYFGYLPTPAHHELGGYETWRARSSFLEVDASVKIEKAIGELLKDVLVK